MALFARDNTPRATDAQKEYIESLLEKTGTSFDWIEDEIGRELDSLDQLTMQEASEVIDGLKEM